MRLLCLLLLVFAGNAYSIDKPAAYSQCQTYAASDGPASSGCNDGYICSGTGPAPGAFNYTKTSNGHVCPNGNFPYDVDCNNPSQTWDSITKTCSVCPSGQVPDVSGQCIIKPSDCSLTEFNAMSDGCPLELETGWEFHSCWDYTQNTVAFVQACSPNCGSGQHVEGNSCVDNPTCIGGQTYNFQTNSCDEPVCSGQQTVDPTTHTCTDPLCDLQAETMCNSICWPNAQCSTGYTSTCNITPETAPTCEFSGCPSGYSSGTVNGVPTCAPSTDTPSHTCSTGVPTSDGFCDTNNDGTGDKNPDGSDKVTCTNGTPLPNGKCDTDNDGQGNEKPDGTPIYDKGTGTGTYDASTGKISIDLSGVAKESTLQGISDKLSSFFGKSSDFSSDTSDLNSHLTDLLATDSPDFASEVSNTTNPYNDLFGVNDWLPSFPGSSDCSGTIPLSWHGSQYDFSPCQKLAPLREVLAWVFYVLSAMYIINVWFSVKD